MVKSIYKEQDIYLTHISESHKYVLATKDVKGEKGFFAILVKDLPEEDVSKLILSTAK